MHIAICDDDYLTCNFIENIVLQYSKRNGIPIKTDVYQTAKSLYENFEDSTELCDWLKLPFSISASTLFELCEAKDSVSEEDSNAGSVETFSEGA